MSPSPLEERLMSPPGVLGGRLLPLGVRVASPAPPLEERRMSPPREAGKRLGSDGVRLMPGVLGAEETRCKVWNATLSISSRCSGVIFGAFSRIGFSTPYGSKGGVDVGFPRLGETPSTTIWSIWCCVISDVIRSCWNLGMLPNMIFFDSSKLAFIIAPRSFACSWMSSGRMRRTSYTDGFERAMAAARCIIPADMPVPGALKSPLASCTRGAGSKCVFAISHLASCSCAIWAENSFTRSRRSASDIAASEGYLKR
mmetsp:Transcript_54840/g.130218  ORF Transcript_54840/g.130218 Transcript_54840/m.130218 type:complete len:256 (+) Transcript_54840:185-952(+)